MSVALVLASELQSSLCESAGIAIQLPGRSHTMLLQSKVVFNKTERRNHQLDMEYWKKDGLSNMEYSVRNLKVLMAERFWRVSVTLNTTSVDNAKPYPRWPGTENMLDSG